MENPYPVHTILCMRVHSAVRVRRVLCMCSVEHLDGKKLQEPRLWAGKSLPPSLRLTSSTSSQLQAWWRGTMVRRSLGPYKVIVKKAPEGKAKGKDKGKKEARVKK